MLRVMSLCVYRDHSNIFSVMNSIVVYTEQKQLVLNCVTDGIQSISLLMDMFNTCLNCIISEDTLQVFMYLQFQLVNRPGRVLSFKVWIKARPMAVIMFTVREISLSTSQLWGIWENIYKQNGKSLSDIDSNTEAVVC